MKGLKIRIYRSSGKVGITEPELAEAAKTSLLGLHFPPDVRGGLVVSTWPCVTTTRVSWVAEHRKHRLRGDRYLALHRTEFMVYHDDTTYATGAIPPLVAGPEWWSQAVRGLFKLIVQEIEAWTVGHEWAPSENEDARNSAIPEGARAYVVV